MCCCVGWLFIVRSNLRVVFMMKVFYLCWLLMICVLVMCCVFFIVLKVRVSFWVMILLVLFFLSWIRWCVVVLCVCRVSDRLVISFLVMYLSWYWIWLIMVGVRFFGGLMILYLLKERDIFCFIIWRFFGFNFWFLIIGVMLFVGGVGCLWFWVSCYWSLIRLLVDGLIGMWLRRFLVFVIGCSVRFGILLFWLVSICIDCIVLVRCLSDVMVIVKIKWCCLLFCLNDLDLRFGWCLLILIGVWVCDSLSFCFMFLIMWLLWFVLKVRIGGLIWWWVIREVWCLNSLLCWVMELGCCLLLE